GFNLYAVIALVAVLFATLRDLSTRAMPRGVPSLLLAAATSTVMIIVGLVMGLAESWIWPDQWQLMRLVLAAVFLNIAYYFTIVALRAGEISVVSPFRYSIIIWSIIAGYVFWDDVPGGLTLAGAAIVILAGAYTLHQERS